MTRRYLGAASIWRSSLVTFIEVPEEEEFAPTCRGGADVTEQVNAGIPEHAVETQNDLQTEESTETKSQTPSKVLISISNSP